MSASDDARLIGTGTFKLDRSRAVDKLAHFQLADPRDYVRELVAAAVCAGASEIRVRNDADDFELEWDGAHPELDDLDGFFDAIFHRGTDRRGRMLQHLAQGVLGALGMDPRWVRLMRPGLTLDLTDPKAPKTSENDRTQGVRIEVRERFGLDVLWEWGRKPFNEPEELTRLRTVAVGCPVPILVDGRPLDLDLNRHLGRPAEGVVQVALDRPHCRGEVWLAADAPGAESILLIRDGVRVDHKPVDLHGVRVAGHVRCDALKLDASQTAVVEDRTWKAVVTAVEGAVRRLLADFLSACEDRPPSRHLLLARALVDGPDDVLAPVPLFADLRARLWSLTELDRAPRILVTEHIDLYDESLDLPQLDGDTKLLHRLSGWFEHRVTNGTRELRDRARGRHRRAALMAQAVPLSIDAPHTVSTDRHPSGAPNDFHRMRVGVAPEGADWEDIRIEFRVDGLPVQTAQEKGPGPVLVRVEDSRLVADPTFSKVGPESVRAELFEQARLAAIEAALEGAAAHPHHPDVRAVFRRHVRWALPRKRQRKGASALPRELRELPMFAHSSEGFVSLDAVEGDARALGRLDKRGRPLIWYVPATEPSPDAQARVLHLDGPDISLLQRLFGGRLVDVGKRLANEATARQRRRQGRAEAVLPPHLQCLETIELDQPEHTLSGIAGLRADPAAIGCPCTVVREGVVLGVIDLPVNLPGAILAVDWGGAEPTADWSGLADPDSAALFLAELLEPTLLDLARTAALERTHLLGPLPDWLVALLMRGPKAAAELSGLAFVTTPDGDHRLLGEPVQRLRGARGGLHLLPPDTTVPHHLRRRFHIGDSDHLLVLQKWHGQRNVKDGRPLLEEHRSKHRAFQRKPTVAWSLPEGTVAGTVKVVDGLELRMGLDGRQGARDGFAVSVHHDRRELERIYRKAALPWQVVARGPFIAPNAAHSATADVAMVRRVLEVARELRANVLERLAAEVDRPDVEAPTLRLAMHVLLELLKRRMRWLGTDRSRTLRHKFEQTALFVDAEGRRHTLSQLRIAHAEGRLGTLRKLPSGVRPPAGHIWLLQARATDALLREELGSRPFDATPQAMQQAQGNRRRESVAPTPLAEVGRHVCQRTTEVRLPGVSGRGHIWVGLSPGQPGQRQFRIDQKAVCRDKLPELPGVRIAVEHPALEANAAFDEVGPRSMVQDLRARSMEALYALLDTALMQGPPPELIDLAVRIHAAHRHGDCPLTSDPPLLEVTDGPPLRISVLRTLSFRRVAPPGTRGRPLPGAPPVFVGYPSRRRALEAWGPVDDATDSLVRAQAAWARMEAPPHRPAVPPAVVASIEVPAPRAGRLFVVWSRHDAVVVRVDGRALCTVQVGAPLPLVGWIDDPAVTADPWFERIADRRTERVLDDALTACANQLLDQLLGTSDVPEEILYDAVLRCFSHKSEVHNAKGVRARLARHPLFQVGTTGERCSLLDLVHTPSGPRLHSGSHGYESLDARRPLVRVPEAHIDALVDMLGGTDVTAEASREHAAAHRRKSPRRPFALEDSDWLARVERSRGRSKWVAGLRTDTEWRGRVEVRVDGRPAGSLPIEAPGMMVVLELDPRKVNPLDPTPEPDKNLLQAVQATYAALIEAAGTDLALGPARTQRVCRMVHSVHHKLKKGKLPGKRSWQRPWLTVPLLQARGDTRVSIDHLCRLVSRDGLVVWDDSSGAVEADLLLRRDTLNEAVIDVLGWTDAVRSANAWEAQRRKEQAAAEAAKAAHARRRRIERTEGELKPLLDALHMHQRDPGAAAERSLRRATDVDLADVEGFAALAALAWRLADMEAIAQGGGEGPGGVEVVEQLTALLVARLDSARS